MWNEEKPKYFHVWRERTRSILHFSERPVFQILARVRTHIHSITNAFHPNSNATLFFVMNLNLYWQNSSEWILSACFPLRVHFFHYYCGKMDFPFLCANFYSTYFCPCHCHTFSFSHVLPGIFYIASGLTLETFLTVKILKTKVLLQRMDLDAMSMSISIQKVLLIKILRMKKQKIQFFDKISFIS